MTVLIGADQPFGISKKLSYQMIAERYTGRVLYVTFRTRADLSKWLPPPLQMENVHEGFLKLYELKRRPVDGVPYPPAFSQYYEACIAVLAAPPGEIYRHYNLFMWVSHDWALYKARSAIGWPKKIASIAMTFNYPDGQDYDRDCENSAFDVDVHRYGYPIISVRAKLSSKKAAGERQPFNGFYTVRNIPSPIDGGERVCELLVVEPQDGWFGAETWGEATVELNDAPDEELRLLGPVEVTGCVLRDTGWVLPAWPAKRLMKLDSFQTDVGVKRPPEAGGH